jgi:hypothetical protein
VDMLRAHDRSASLSRKKKKTGGREELTLVVVVAFGSTCSSFPPASKMKWDRWTELCVLDEPRILINRC